MRVAEKCHWRGWMAGLSHSNRLPFEQLFLDLYDELRLNMIFMRQSKKIEP